MSNAVLLSSVTHDNLINYGESTNGSDKWIQSDPINIV